MKRTASETPRLVVAVDLGGTNLRTAVIDESGQIIRRVRRATPQGEIKAEAIGDAIVAAVAACVAPGDEIASAAIMVPGTVDSSNETVIQAPNLSALDGFNLKAYLQSQWSHSVLLENDANAAAVGEMWKGSARGCGSVVCLTLGTGIGGGIVLDGKLWRGALGAAAEIGHMTMEPSSKIECACGNTGCLEVFASATAIARMARDGLWNYPDSLLHDGAGTAEIVFNAAMKNDALALQIFETVGRYLGIATASLINILNPEVIVFGGGVANAWPLFERFLHEEVRRRAFTYPAQRVKLLAAQCGDDAGLLGAAHLALFDRT